MELITKSIYSRPEISRRLLPLWGAWAMTAIGGVCGFFLFTYTATSSGLTSLLVGGLTIGAASLITVLCFYIVGDSHRPYHKQLQTLLQPTFRYYAASSKKEIIEALEHGDEASLNNIKSTQRFDLVLIRYQDNGERIIYSQLTESDGKRFIPVTDIIVNHRSSPTTKGEQH